ncbi:MAG: hypothetical protein IT269_14215 [Saprospiraceae bacterium]|nr:hypothetical protein [Saprospiraceae bacterium]
MLSLFRSSRFTVAFLIALYLLLTHATALFGLAMPDATETSKGSTMLYRALFGHIEQPFYSALAAYMLVFIQAIMVNILADRYRLLGERNWLPGMAYALVASSLPEFLFLSPALVAATFITISLMRIFSAYKLPKAAAALFDAGFWIVAASLFYPPAAWLIPAAYIGLSIVRSFKAGEQILFLIGLIVPYFLAWVVCFWLDLGSVFRAEQWNGLWGFYHFSPDLSGTTLYKWGILAVLLLIVLFNFAGISGRKSIDLQKFNAVFNAFLVMGFLSVFFQNDPSRTHFQLINAPVGIFLALSLFGMRNRGLAEAFHFIILLVILAVQLSCLS